MSNGLSRLMRGLGMAPVGGDGRRVRAGVEAEPEPGGVAPEGSVAVGPETVSGDCRTVRRTGSSIALGGYFSSTGEPGRPTKCWEDRDDFDFGVRLFRARFRGAMETGRSGGDVITPPAGPVGAGAHL